MAELIVFAGTSDGYITSSDPSYATARAGNTLSVSDLTVVTVGQQEHPSLSRFFVIEAFETFDVSGLEADATAATPSLWLTADSSTTDFTVEMRLCDWGETLETSDFVSGADLSALPLLASIDTNGIGATGQYKAFTAEAALVTAINDARAGDGILRVILCSSRTTNGDVPSTNTQEMVEFSSADETGTTQDPKLVIEYDEPLGQKTKTVEASAALSAVEERTVVATAALSKNGVVEMLVQVAALADDRVQHGGTTTSVDTGSFIVGTNDTSLSNHHVLWRFLSVNIAQGVTIHSATVALRKVTTQSQLSYWTWYGENSDTVTSVTGPIDSRPKTTASTLENTNVERVDGEWYEWDIRSIVQELVNRPGWVEGNNLALIADGNGPVSFALTAWYDYNADPDSAAILTIQYQAEPIAKTISTTAALQATTSRSLPATATLSAVVARTVGATATLSDTGITLGVLTTAVFSAVETQTVAVTAALQFESERSIAVTAALQASFSGTLPATAALLRSLTRTIQATATLSELSAVTLAVTASAALSRPVLIIPPGRQGRPAFTLTLYGPLPGKRLINHMALPPEVQLAFGSELPGGWVRATAGVVREELRRALTASDVQEMLLPDPVNVPPFGHAEIHTEGGHLVWEGRVSSRRQIGGEVRGIVLAGYGSSGLKDGRMPERSGPAGTNVVVQTALREGAPLIEPLEINDPGVLRELAEFTGRHPYDVLEAVSQTGCGTCPGWTWTVYRRQLRFFALSAPAIPTYRVPVDSTIERDLNNEIVYTAVVMTYTDLDGTIRSTPVIRDYDAETRYEITRILPLSGGQMTPSAAIAFARTELRKRVNEGVAVALTRTWDLGLETSYGGERPIWEVQAGESLQVGDELPQYITGVEYDQLAGRGTIRLGEPVFPEEAAIWRGLVSAETALRNNRNVVTRTTQG